MKILQDVSIYGHVLSSRDLRDSASAAGFAGGRHGLACRAATSSSDCAAEAAAVWVGVIGAGSMLWLGPFVLLFPSLMAGRFPCLTCVAFGVILLGVQASGHAQVEYHVVAGGLIGASDNPRSLQDGAGAQTEGFVTAEGRLELGYIGRLTRERIAYGIMATSWTGNALGSSLAHTLNLASEIQAGPETRITLNGAAALMQLSMLDATAATNPQTAGPRPAGDQKFLSLSAGEALSWQLGRSWSMAQSLDGGMYRPLGSAPGVASNKSLTLGTALNHLWQRDSGGLRGRLGAITTESNTQAGQPTIASPDSQFAQLESTWRHEWTAELSHELSAGVLFLRMDGVHAFPVESAAILWRRGGGDIGLHAEQSVGSNIYVGTVYQRSLVSLNISLPLDRYELLRLLAAADLEHDSASAVANGAGGTANVFAMHIGLHWMPGNTFTYGLDYTFRDQRASAAASSGASEFASFRRQLVVFSIEAQYPSRF